MFQEILTSIFDHYLFKEVMALMLIPLGLVMIWAGYQAIKLLFEMRNE